MVTKTEHFITQMKLRELREQRNRLSQAYNNLLQNTAQEPTEAGRLRSLYEGLRNITFAKQRLHTELANLEPLFERPDEHALSQETITFWRQRLEKELDNGLLRSEIMYIFGAILEEWASTSTTTESINAALQSLQTTLIEPQLQPTKTGDYSTLLDTLFSDFAFSDQTERSKQFQTNVQNILQQRVTTNELTSILEQININPYYSTTLRKQTQSFIADPIMQKELTDALAIMLEHVDEWQHLQEGVEIHPIWTLTKWRLCVEEDLPTLCFLEILGQRWQEIFEQFFVAERNAKFKQLTHQDLSPQSTRMAWLLNNPSQGFYANSLTDINIWATEKEAPLSPEEFYKHAEHHSIFEHRLTMKHMLHDLEKLSNYDTLQTVSNMENALMLVNAEIELARAIPSPLPLYILKIDLKDFYPNLSHQMLLDILQHYGLTPSQQAFFKTFMRIPLHYQEQIVTYESGIPHNHRLSHLLGELTLGLFEQHLQNHAQVQIVRIIDDICLLATSADAMTRAWEAIGTFCEAFGLVLNQEKCGSTCIGGANLPLLPSAQPGWLLLTINSQGYWEVNWGAFETFLQQARQQISQSSSLISQIETYNTHLEYLVKALAMRADLGVSHRQEISKAMERFSQAFFGEGQSSIDTIRHLIQERFLNQNSTLRIPEAWLYWPITAGGCGLLQATILATGYQAHFSQHAHVAAPEGPITPDWQYRLNAWSAFYKSFTHDIRANEPETNQVMETLVKDFIQRGSEVSNRHQASLSSYWRWILYIYGPQILDALGTFRFLITELVPLQLIVQKYREGANDELIQ
jgi:hypothetical protein